MLRPRYIMLGGFLGAGKTTAMMAFAQLLRQRGFKVGAITNDQSVGLVDTQMLQAAGHQTEEIAGGCFCCKFNSLVEAAERLTVETQPDMLIAEPVGSCTDLRATVSEPLRQIYGDRVLVAPLSVVIDPIRAQGIFGLRPGKQFTPKVNYIYEKQLEEADVIVMNKIDLINEDQRRELRAAIEQRWPEKLVFEVCVRSGDGVREWLDHILQNEMKSIPSMDVDYDEYAEGEALLGWLNVAGTLQGDEFDGNRWLVHAAKLLHRNLLESLGEIEIAHLKMTIIPQPGNDLGVINLVRSSGQAELAYQLTEPLELGELTLNLRAEADPEQMQEVVRKSLVEACESQEVEWNVEQIQAFRPGRPVPVHRLGG